MKRALVFHPGLQHSHQLAWALHEKGMLERFFSGIPVLGPHEKLPWWWPQRIKERIKLTAIPTDKKQSALAIYSASRVLADNVLERWRENVQHTYFYAYDSWAAKQVLRLKPSLVVAFENSALNTFQAAKHVGARCILDLPSIHHSAGRQILHVPQTAFRTKIDRRKDLEVESADLLLTCSRFAANTYLECGAQPTKIRTVLLGASVELKTKSRQLEHDGCVKFVFAGAFTFRKSADLLLETFRRLHQQGLDATLDVIGTMPESEFFRALSKIPNIRYHGSLPQSELFTIIAKSDCLLLPSRFDSFGMVVAEALSCGVPVIVSSATGAREIIEEHPFCGWVVEPELESVYQCIRERISDRSSLRIAKKAAVIAADSFSWREYRRKVGEAVASWYDENS